MKPKKRLLTHAEKVARRAVAVAEYWVKIAKELKWSRHYLRPVTKELTSARANLARVEAATAAIDLRADRAAIAASDWVAQNTIPDFDPPVGF